MEPWIRVLSLPSVASASAFADCIPRVAGMTDRGKMTRLPDSRESRANPWAKCLDQIRSHDKLKVTNRKGERTNPEKFERNFTSGQMMAAARHNQSPDTNPESRFTDQNKKTSQPASAFGQEFAFPSLRSSPAFIAATGQAWRTQRPKRPALPRDTRRRCPRGNRSQTSTSPMEE